jgi:hypothetical protein
MCRLNIAIQQGNCQQVAAQRQIPDRRPNLCAGTEQLVEAD